MSISDNYVPVKQIGNGVTTQFSGNWKMFNSAYARVYLESVATGVQVPQTLGANFSIAISDSGFIVTMNVAPTNANYVIVGREIDLTQTDPYRTSKGFQGDKIEDSFDKLTGIAQDQADENARSLKFKLGSTATGYQIEDPIDGRSLKWDTVNGQIINSDSDIDTVVAQVDADAAAAAADRAAADAANASAQNWANVAQSAAVGTTWTKSRMRSTANLVLSGVQTINGVVGVANDRVLVMNQAATATNGLYNMLAGAWTRTADADTWDELVSKVVVIEESGTTYAETAFICSSNRGGTLGVTAVTFIDFTPPLGDGAVSTTAKIVDGIITYAKMAATAIGSLSDAIAGTTGKLIDASTLKLFGEAKFAVSSSVATTGGTSIDILNGVGGISIPAGTKRLTLNFAGVSTNGTDNLLIHLASGGSFQITGYSAVSSEVVSSANTQNSTTGFVARFSAAANSLHGSLVFTLVDAATFTWALSGNLCNSLGTQSIIPCSGSKSLTGVIEGLRLTTSSGVSVFDAGKINVLAESW